MPCKTETDYEREFSLDNPVDHANQLDLLRKWLNPGASILDCGSGSGYLSTVLALLVCSEAESAGRVTSLERRTAFTSACIPRIATTLNAISDFNSNGNEARVFFKTAPCITQRIVVLPVDGTDDLVFPNAPYDAIRVGFALPSEESQETTNLLKQLRRGGRMIAHVGDNPVLTIFDKDSTSGQVSSTLADRHAMFPPPLCQRRVLVERDPDLTPEEVAAAEAKEAKTKARREQLFAELQTWRADFEAREGRRPTRQDIASDEQARDLFIEFSKVNTQQGL